MSAYAPSNEADPLAGHLVPIPLAGALIPDPDGRCWLLRRHIEGKQRWEVPGGKIGANDPDEAAMREVQEELGVQVELVAHIATDRFEEGDQIYLCYWYLAQIQAGIPEIMEPQYFDQLQPFSWDEILALSDVSPGLETLRQRYTPQVLEHLAKYHIMTL